MENSLNGVRFRADAARKSNSNTYGKQHIRIVLIKRVDSLGFMKRC